MTTLMPNTMKYFFITTLFLCSCQSEQKQTEQSVSIMMEDSTKSEIRVKGAGNKVEVTSKGKAQSKVDVSGEGNEIIVIQNGDTLK